MPDMDVNTASTAAAAEDALTHPLVKFQWKIERFPQVTDLRYYSPPFEAGPYTWCVRCPRSFHRWVGYRCPTMEYSALTHTRSVWLGGGSRNMLILPPSTEKPGFGLFMAVKEPTTLPQGWKRCCEFTLHLVNKKRPGERLSKSTPWLFGEWCRSQLTAAVVGLSADVECAIGGV